MTYRPRWSETGECERRLKGQDSNLRAGLLLGWLTASCLTTRLPLNVDVDRQVGGHLFPTIVISWRGRSRTLILSVNSRAHCLSGFTVVLHANERLRYSAPRSPGLHTRVSTRLPRMGSNHRLQPYYGRRSPLSYSGKRNAGCQGSSRTANRSVWWGVRVTIPAGQEPPGLQPGPSPYRSTAPCGISVEFLNVQSPGSFSAPGDSLDSASLASLVRPGSSGRRGPDSRIAIGSGILPLLVALDFLCVLEVHLLSALTAGRPGWNRTTDITLIRRAFSPLNYESIQRRCRRRGKKYCIRLQRLRTPLFSSPMHFFFGPYLS